METKRKPKPKGVRLKWTPISQAKSVRLGDVKARPVRVSSDLLKKKNRFSGKSSELYIP